MSETSDRPFTREESREQARERAREQARERARAADLRRRRALVFGEVLPESTRDDLADPLPPGPAGSGRPATPDGDPGGLDDEWWRRQVPPHHG